jgi:hypothetical protein
LAQVLIVEADAFVAQWKDLKLPDGRDRVLQRPSSGSATWITEFTMPARSESSVRDRS